jgi:hypothetical protein
MKIIKRLLIFLFLVIIIVLGLLYLGINRISTTVTEADLPQDVYESNGDISVLLLSKAAEIVLADEEDSYTLIEDFINLLIFDIIKDNINPEYDPINGDDEVNKYIISRDKLTIDYIYAHLNEENQLIVTVSIKRPNIVETAFHFVFDIEYEFSSFSLTLSLDKVFLHDIEIKRNIYDYFVSMADKNQVEQYVETGELDLEEYTYSISFFDLVGL